jgi:MFS family permease
VGQSGVLPCPSCDLTIDVAALAFISRELVPRARIGLVGPFHVRGFATLFVSTWLSYGGTTMGIVVISWIAYDVTSSPIAPAVAVATLTGTGIVLGPPSGILADRVNRRAIMLWSNGIEAISFLLISLLLVNRVPALTLVFFVGLVLGAFHAIRTPPVQALVLDLIEGQAGGSAIAMMNLGKPMASLAAPAIGFVLKSGSAEGALLLVALFFALSLGVALIRPPNVRRVHPPPSSRAKVSKSIRRPSRDLRHLTILTAAIEILGFSSIVLLPVFARDVFSSGVIGLSLFHAVRGAGAVAGLILLVLAPSIMDRDRALPTMMAIYGLGLLAFAISRTLAFALLLWVVIGALQGIFDASLQVKFQRLVPPSERGYAMGLWVFGVGFGPLGYVELGFLADVAGVRMAQALNGVALTTLAAFSSRSQIHDSRRDQADKLEPEGEPSSTVRADD